MRVCLLLLVAIAGPLAQAHDARPNFVQVVETEPNTFSVSWKVPASIPGQVLPYPVLPAGCVAEREPAWQQARAEYTGRQVFRCSGPLSGRTVGLRFPAFNPSLSTLYKVTLANGEAHARILGPDETEWTVPDAESRSSVAIEYTTLGIRHIWLGIDHLLFVACLLFIAGTGRRLLITITGFTIAHSITLALSTLDVVRLPTTPVEAAIALSVVFMAWEIAKGDTDSLAYRFPATIAVAFGLLHGFGFAAVLREIGLPQTELPAALLFFNVGVEISQLLFVLGLLVGYYLLRPVLAHLARQRQERKVHWSRFSVPASYAVGSIASYWLIDRVVVFWA